jgi:twitching motility protein PilU
MQTFDQSLFQLFKRNQVELQTALDNADSRTDLEWRINFGGGVDTGDASAAATTGGGDGPAELDDLPRE